MCVNHREGDFTNQKLGILLFDARNIRAPAEQIAHRDQENWIQGNIFFIYVAILCETTLYPK